jgi:hypothetical protein
MLCNQKKKGLNSHHADCLHDPKRPCFPYLLHTIKTSDLPPDTSLLTLSGVHYKIKEIQVLCFHRPTEQTSQHPSTASHIHTTANKRNSPVTDYIHCPKAQACFPTKCSRNMWFLLWFSLSRIPLQQLGQVPGATESSSIQPSSPN